MKNKLLNFLIYVNSALLMMVSLIGTLYFFGKGGYVSGLSDPILTTTLTETDNVVVALTYKGFVNIAEGFKDMNGFKHSTRKERYESLALELETKMKGKE